MAEQRLSEQLAVVACIDPDAYTTGAATSDEIDMRYHDRVVFIVMAGTLGSSATLDFKLQGCATSGGSFSDISGKSITQLTQAGTDADKQAIVEITGAEAYAAGPYRYIQGVMTVGAATSDAGAIALADCTRRVPASELDLTSVDEIVA